MILHSDPKLIGQFLALCESNWHRCGYVSCNGCPRIPHCDQQDFLFALTEEAVPVILSITDAKIIFSERPEPEECLISLPYYQFITLYGKYLALQKLPSDTCLAGFLIKQSTEKLYDW